MAAAWTDLVFHVLAHLPSAAPSSLYDARYVAYVAARLPARDRDLALELAPLGAIAQDHARYASLQALAFLHATTAEAVTFVRRDLAEISPSEVGDGGVLATLRSVTAEAEILRAVAELEAERHRALPSMTFDAEELATALADAMSAAPALRCADIRCLPALMLRGRLHGGRIWVGMPNAELGISASHVAWQAAHEATVGELLPLAAASAPFDDRPLEHAALVLLAQRAKHGGLEAEHARWLAHLTHLPPLDRDRLLEPFRTEVAARLRTG